MSLTILLKNANDLMDLDLQALVKLHLKTFGLIIFKYLKTLTLFTTFQPFMLIQLNGKIQVIFHLKDLILRVHFI